MTFTTKLNVGDTAFFIKDNQVTEMKVECVAVEAVLSIYTQKANTSPPEYGFRIYNELSPKEFARWLKLSEDKVFDSKAALLASL